MKFPQIRFTRSNIVVIITIGLIILSVFLFKYQWQITSFILSNKEKQFIQNVRSALAEAAKKIEEKEIISKLTYKNLIIQNNSVNLDKDLMKILLEQDSNNVLNQQDDYYIYKQKEIKKTNRSIFVIYLISTLTQKKISLEARIDPKKVENILKTTFDEFGIRAKYEFAILDSAKNIYYQTTGFTFRLQKTKHNSKSYFYQSLFTDDLYYYFPKFTLVVAFPDEKRMQYESLTKLIMPSVIISLMIIILFGIVLYLFFKQKKIDQMKNNFIHNMTHELKTPIATIRLSAEMIKDTSLNLPEDSVQNLGKTIFSEAKRLQFLVEKILQIAMLERGMAIIKKEFVQAHKLLNLAIDNFQIHISRVKGQLIKNYNATDDTIFVDKEHFINVIQNLLDNSVKYRNKKKRLKIEITTENTNTSLVIKISDNGIGMSKEQQKHIFDDFYRGQSVDIHNIKGFGLGLSYVKRILTEFDAEVQVFSEEQKGTTFVIILPLVGKEEE